MYSCLMDKKQLVLNGDRYGVAKELYVAAQNDKGKLKSPKFSELAQIFQNTFAKRTK
jgi:hypothetical protein